MEFPFDIRKVLKPNEVDIAILDPKIPQIRTKEVAAIIDSMGLASSRAQGLRNIITTSSKFFSCSDNTIYIKIHEQKVVGILKTGYRRLFHSDSSGKMLQLYPLCLLDFYVHESMQRTGYGRELYEHMLQHQAVTPNKIAIDRPSAKLLAFMRKYYCLSDYVPQNNFFVVYRQFFIHNYKTPVYTPRVQPKEEPSVFTPQYREDFQNNQTSRPNLQVNYRQTTPYQETRRQNFRPLQEVKKNARNIISGHIQRRPASNQSRERKMLQQNSSSIAITEQQLLETQEKIRKLHLNVRQNYQAPIPPWATSATSYSTSSSQYGSYLRNKQMENSAIGIILVGNANTGKTSLLKQYLGEELSDVYVPSVLDVFTAEVELNSNKQSLEIIDSGGSQKHDELRKLAYEKAHVVLLVFSMVQSESFVSVQDRWYRQIVCHAPNVPVILVGNKCELVGEEDKMRENSRFAGQVAEAREVCQKLGFRMFLMNSVNEKDWARKVFNKAIMLSIEERTPKVVSNKKCVIFYIEFE